MQTILKLENLTKYFNYENKKYKILAVDNLNLEIKQGEIFGLLGANGCGKSTTIKIILNLLNQTSGSCYVFGKSSKDFSIKKRIGYLPETPDFYKFLTARKLLSFYGKICGLKGAFLNNRIDYLIDLVGLNGNENKTLKAYSKGMLQRIGLASAIIHNPDFIILDEPTAGVDPIGSADIANIILGLKNEDKTVLISSHFLSSIEKICTNIAIMNQGKIEIQGELSSLLKNPSGQKISLDELFLSLLRK